jgi:hypothetical protein
MFLTHVFTISIYCTYLKLGKSSEIQLNSYLNTLITSNKNLEGVSKLIINNSVRVYATLFSLGKMVLKMNQTKPK